MIATRVDGPAAARATIVLAHGAGAGMDHPFLATVARGLADHGFRVVRFDFPYRTAGKRAPDRMPVLQALNLEAADAFLEVARQAYQQVGSPTCFVRGMVGLFYALCDQFDPLRNFRANR